jgi:glycogen operon protein
LVRFVQTLIAFRKSQPSVRSTRFLRGEPSGPGALPDVCWYGNDGNHIDWNSTAHSLVCLLGAPRPEAGRRAGSDILTFFHGGRMPQDFVFPKLAFNLQWRLFIDTAAESPLDIYPAFDGPAPPDSGRITLSDRSLVCYVASE